MAPKKRVEGHGPWAPGDDQQHGRPQKGGAALNGGGTPVVFYCDIHLSIVDKWWLMYD